MIQVPVKFPRFSVDEFSEIPENPENPWKNSRKTMMFFADKHNDAALKSIFLVLQR